MYICVKLPPGDLNPNPYPLHPTSTYTYRLIITPRVCEVHFTSKRSGNS